MTQQAAPPAASSPDDDTPPRSTFGLLRDRTFGPFFGGKLLAVLGVWIHNVAAAILVWELTRSTLLVGAVSIGQFLPQILLAPLTGAQADRGNRRLQLVVGRAVTGIGGGGLAVWMLTVGVEGTSGAIAVIASSTIVGIGFVLGGPAMNALLPSLVRRSELPAAIALNALPMMLSRALGPAIGALLVTSTNPAVAFAVAASTNIVYVIVLLYIHIDEAPRDTKDRSIGAGMRYVRAHPVMAMLLLGGLTTGIGADPVITLTPALADRLGYDSGFVGVLASTAGVGAAIGFLLLAPLRRRIGLPRLAFWGLVMLSVSMALNGIAPVAAVAVVGFGISGFGMAAALTALMTLLQQKVPEELRGRVMALWSVAFLGSRPLAAGLSGMIADTFSVTAALFVVAALLAGGALLVRPSRTTEPPSV